MSPLKFFAAAALLLSSTSASAEIVVVQGTSNIFAAGSATIPPGAGDGTVPPSFSFAAADGLILTFSSVVGTVGADFNFPSQTNGPEGGIYNGNVGTNVNSTGGISGIIHSDFNMFLTGVFLGESIPLTAPPRLSFSQPEDFLTLAPELGQTFFIGDGLTDTGGLTQKFFVPNGATNLYLGFVDAADTAIFEGNPGFYFDNTGAITASFNVSAVPEPSTAIALMSVASVALFRRTRSRRDKPMHVEA